MGRALVVFGVDTEIIREHVLQHVLLCGCIIAADKLTGRQLHPVKSTLTAKVMLAKTKRD